MGRSAIFLDRDGVINKAVLINNKPYSPKYINEIILVPGIEKLLKYLSKRYLLIGITNQSEVARGTISLEEVDIINNYLKSRVFITKFYVCPHDNNDHCSCRKPKSGLLLQASKEYNIDLSNSYFIGDRWSDMEAGRNVGCTTIWLNHKYDERKPNLKHVDYIVYTLDDIYKIIL